MNTHLTIQEAVNETGKSVSTIRRVVKRLSKDAISEQDGKYLIERSALYAALGLSSQPEQAEQVSSQMDSQPSQMTTQVSSQPDIVAILTEQLRVKDEQIQQLLERQREQNVLLGQMRLLAQREPVPVGKSEAQQRFERYFAVAALAIVLLILGLIVWASWHR